MDIEKIVSGIPGGAQNYGTIDTAVTENLSSLDDELMKRGTLSGETINWSTVFESSCAVLERVSHIAAFRGLVAYLCRNGDEHSFHSALLLSKELFSLHFPKLHPQEARKTRLKAAWANEILVTLEAGGERVVENNRGFSSDCSAAMAELITAAAASKQDVRALKKLASKEIKEVEIEEKKSANNSSTEGTSSKLDAKGRSQLKRDIFSIAGRISSHDLDAGVAFHMRGYAAWMEFQFLPDSDENEQTQQHEMPPAIVDEHKKNIPNATPEALLKLEDRLFMSPDWFLGQKYAFDMAVSLGHKNAAQSILERTRSRIDQWPELKKLKYANNSKYVSEGILKWISPEATSPRPVSEKTAQEDSAPKTLKDTLKDINLEILSARSPREKALSKMKFARCLAAENLNAQAEMMFEELKGLIQGSDAAIWDSEFLIDVESELNRKPKVSK